MHALEPFITLGDDTREDLPCGVPTDTAVLDKYDRFMKATAIDVKLRYALAYRMFEFEIGGIWWIMDKVDTEHCTLYVAVNTTPIGVGCTNTKKILGPFVFH